MATMTPTPRRTSRHVRPPDLSTAERDALAEFWQVYEAHFDPLADGIDLDGAEHPELPGFIGPVGSVEVAEIRELIRRAVVHEDWVPYLTQVDAAGTRYAETGLDFGAWFATGRALRMRLTPLVVGALRGDPERLAQALRGAAIYVDLMMITIGNAYLAAKERIITAQQADIRELSTPVLELWDGLLLLPLIGSVDSERAATITETLLGAIPRHRARTIIIDITGVPAVDSAVANHLMRTAEAARLMGATAILAGISAANAQTLASLGIDFSGLQIAGTLADSIQLAAAHGSLA